MAFSFYPSTKTALVKLAKDLDVAKSNFNFSVGTFIDFSIVFDDILHLSAIFPLLL